MPVNFDKWFKELEAAKQLVKKAPRIIANEALGFSLDRFREQAWHDRHREPWPDRKVDTGKALLNFSSHLVKSIRVVSVSDKIVIIGTYVPYAQIHNEGGETHPTVTEKMRKFAWYMTKKDAKNADKWKALALTKKNKLTVKIKKRQFLGNSEKFNRDLNDTFNKLFQKALK